MDPRPALQYPTPPARAATPSITVPRVATGIMLFDAAVDAPLEPTVEPPIAEAPDPVAEAFTAPAEAPEAPVVAAPDDGPTLVPMRHRNELAEGPTVVATPATFVPTTRDWLWVVVAAAGAVGAALGALVMW